MSVRAKYNPSDLEVSGKDLSPVTSWLLVGGRPPFEALWFGKRPVLVHRTGGLLGSRTPMQDSNTTADKSIVEELNFGAKTAKRVSWEAFEFSVESPHLVRVTNASYGFEKDDHSYLVGVEDRDGVLVPAECECKADRYNEEYDCKHKVALATVGGPVVLQAAVDLDNGAAGLSVSARDGVRTGADKLQTDGGTAVADDSDACPNGDDRCDGPDEAGLPCFDCFEVNQ